MTVTVPQPRFASLVVLGALVLVAIALWPTLRELSVLWAGVDPYTHGPLLFLVGLWIVWRMRDRIAGAAWKPCWWFLLPLAAIAILNLVPMINLRLFVLPASILSLIGLIAGPGVLRLLAFPVLLVHFALPGWGFCLPVLLHWTTAVVTVALDLVRIPALIEAQYVTIPAGRFVIEEGCAGMKYFVAGGALATLFAYLYIEGIRRGLLMVAAGFAVSIIANWVRVFGIIVIGHMTNMQSSIVHDHELFGWVVFGLALVPLFLFGGWLADERQVRPDRPGRAEQPGERPDAGATFFAALAGVTLLAAAPVLARTIPPVEYGPVSLPTAFGAFTRVPGQPLIRPALTGAVQREHARYRDETSAVLFSIGLYAGGEKTELINDYEHFEHMTRWRVVADRPVAVTSGHKPLHVRERELSHKRSGKRLTWHWYHVAGNPTSSRNVARLYAARALVGGRRDAAQLVLVASCRNDCDNARLAMERFLADALPVLDEMLARAGRKEIIQ